LHNKSVLRLHFAIRGGFPTGAGDTLQADLQIYTKRKRFIREYEKRHYLWFKFCTPFLCLELKEWLLDKEEVMSRLKEFKFTQFENSCMP
jgi:hypothetical protein